MRHITIWPKSPALNLFNSLLQFNSPIVLIILQFFRNTKLFENSLSYEMCVNLHFPKPHCKSIKSLSSAEEKFPECYKSMYFFFFKQDKISDFKTDSEKWRTGVPSIGFNNLSLQVTAGINFNLPKITNTFEKLALALDFF